jgi:hypothetical protein
MTAIAERAIRCTAKTNALRRNYLTKNFFRGRKCMAGVESGITGRTSGTSGANEILAPIRDQLNHGCA